MMVPTVLAMVVCDAAWRDPDTGKVTLLGIADRVYGSELPVELSQLCVYLQLSGHSGTATVRVVLTRTADEDVIPASPIASAEVTITFADRLRSASGIVTLYNVDLPAFEEYSLTAWFGDEFLELRRVWVEPRP